jgi:hypothetical protein
MVLVKMGRKVDEGFVTCCRGSKRGRDERILGILPFPCVSSVKICVFQIRGPRNS